MKNQSIILTAPGIILGGLSIIGWNSIVPIWAAVPLGALFVFFLAYFGVKFGATRNPIYLGLALIALLPCFGLDGFGGKSLMTLSDQTDLTKSIKSESTASAHLNEYDFAISKLDSLTLEIESLTAEIATDTQILAEIETEQRLVNGMDSDGLLNDHLIPELQTELDRRKRSASTAPEIAGKTAILAAKTAKASNLETTAEQLRQAAIKSTITAANTAETGHFALALAGIAGDKINQTLTPNSDHSKTWKSSVITAAFMLIGLLGESLYLAACILVSWKPKQKPVSVQITESTPEPSPPPKSKQPAPKTDVPVNVVSPDFIQRSLTPATSQNLQPFGIHEYPPQSSRIVSVSLDTPEKIEHQFNLLNRARSLSRYYKKPEIAEIPTEEKFRKIMIAMRPPPNQAAVA